MKITGIILTGGKSRRMGSDKALLMLEGKSLLQRAVDFCSAFCDEVIISSGNKAHQFEGILRIEDEYANCGPISGIYSCLKQSSNEWNFVLSVDAPFLELDFIQHLENETNHHDAVVPLHDGKKEPLIAFYHKRTLPLIENNIKQGNYKLHFLLDELNTNFIDSEVWLEKYPKLFHNLNSREDFDNYVI